MDPYCMLEHLATGRKYKTPTHDDGGKNPKWNHSFDVPIGSRDDLIQISVFDDDVVTDQIIG